MLWEQEVAGSNPVTPTIFSRRISIERIPRSDNLLSRFFGIDTRSLAFFRVALAGAILYDVGMRFLDLKVFHADAGVLPRSVLLSEMHPLRISLHLANGSEAFVAVLFLAQIAAALALLFGWRTRVAAAVSWALLVSLQLRNPIVLQGGDILFRMLAFWAIFLPLGARWSADRALDTSGRRTQGSAVSGGTVAILMQVAMVYLFSASLKTAPEWHGDASAVYYALSLEQFTTPLGTWLLRFPEALRCLTHFVWWIEAAGPLLLLAPFARVRMLGVLVFAVFHLSMGACMRLGTFTLFDLVALTPFLPGSFWDGLEGALRNGKSGVKIFYDADCGFCKKSVFLLREFLALGPSTVLPAQGEPAMHELMKRHNSWIVEAQGRRYHKFDAFIALVWASPVFSFLAPLFRWKPVHAAGTRVYEWVAGHRAAASVPVGFLRFGPAPAEPGALAGGIAFLFLIYVFFWNWSTLPVDRGERGLALPRGFSVPGRALYLDQKWDMFSPYPMKNDGWFVIPAKLADGTRVDLFRGGRPLSWEKPRHLSRTFKNHRWRKYMTNLLIPRNRHYARPLADYLCREWNRKHPPGDPKALESFEICFMQEPTLPGNRTGEIRKKTLAAHRCSVWRPKKKDVV